MAYLMLIFNKIADLQGYLSPFQSSHKTVGFVPTMGALHAGHLSLITESKNNTHITVCSIFVNPTQFNDPKDLERYPRTPEKDIELLKSANCDVVFMPSVEEMYPINAAKEHFDFGHLDKILEGQHRPGHFSGVAQVVKRFFQIVSPTKAFFGSKDYQQVMIVRALVQQMNAPIEIIACPILREADGLAMSSRNMLLNAEERVLAAQVPQIMQSAKQTVLKTGPQAAKLQVEALISKMPHCRYEYFEVCEANTLKPVSSLEPDTKYVGLIALFVGKIRLIDNLTFSL